MESGGYIDGFKEAKRLVSEGRAQLKSYSKSEERFRNNCESGVFKNNDSLRDEIQTHLLDREEYAIENVLRGLEEYNKLLNYGNVEHFKRIKTAIAHTLEEFDDIVPAKSREKYQSALFVGPE